MRVLAIALPGIGDSLLFTPAASLVRKKIPGVQMDALVMFKGAGEIYEKTGLFNNVIYHDFLKSSVFSSIRFVLGLRGKYDASLNIYPSNRREYNIIQFMIGAKRRGAVRYRRRDLRQLGFLNNVRITENDSLHNVEENVALCKELFGFDADAIPDLLLPIAEEDERAADEFLRANKIDGKSLLIGFHPGGSTLKNHINKRWEPSKFAALGRLLIQEHDAKLLVFGGNDETSVKEEIIREIGSPDAISVATPGIVRTAAIIKRCDLFVTNDSSLMHIASAMKRKVVAVEGPLNTNYTYPWHTEYKIASLKLECSPCFVYSPRPLKCFRHDVKFKCIRELQVDALYNKITAILG